MMMTILHWAISFQEKRFFCFITKNEMSGLLQPIFLTETRSFVISDELRVITTLQRKKKR